jgi:hypothetical protein
MGRGPTFSSMSTHSPAAAAGAAFSCRAAMAAEGGRGRAVAVLAVRESAEAPDEGGRTRETRGV